MGPWEQEVGNELWDTIYSITGYYIKKPVIEGYIFKAKLSAVRHLNCFPNVDMLTVARLLVKQIIEGLKSGSEATLCLKALFGAPEHLGPWVMVVMLLILRLLIFCH